MYGFTDAMAKGLHDDQMKQNGSKSIENCRITAENQVPLTDIINWDTIKCGVPRGV